MRIGTTGNSLFNRNQRSLQSALMRLSTAQRINTASDDASGLAISEQLSSRVRGFRTAGRNVQDAMSAMNVSDGAGERVTDILQRQRELALQAGNGTLSDRDREMMDREFQQLNQEIEEISQNTEFNTQNVAQGSDLTDGNQEISAGPDGGDTIAIPEVDFRPETLGMDTATIATTADAQEALQSIDAALEQVSDQRSEIGSTINRFSTAISTIQTAETNTTAAESAIRDQDMARGIAQLTQEQLLSESSTQAFSLFREISSDHIMNLLQ
ncbi:flagellin [Chitinivibrio alkaliphilus]|uniref:Flagellin n=1 Tax=Chitinivibrio alkaliphilus ACht1 TaxID=1313304 RepID=U7DA15_9BACT|nr:flagellin [Chitinivibrio alkaliphilus]ERP31270.1 flagellin [Chitinivibrio alkaliphilus ACht1]